MWPFKTKNKPKESQIISKYKQIYQNLLEEKKSKEMAAANLEKLRSKKIENFLKDSEDDFYRRALSDLDANITNILSSKNDFNCVLNLHMCNDIYKKYNAEELGSHINLAAMVASKLIDKLQRDGLPVICKDTFYIYINNDKFRKILLSSEESITRNSKSPYRD
jgi:hypothetical protein